MENLVNDIDAILITGPTASGKSALAVTLARAHGGVVVNADSMQVYDTLRVLTARPSDEEMQGVEHLLYGHVPAGRSYSSGEWLREAAVLVADLRGLGRLPVFVGGTGLYFKALTGGLSDMPEVDQDIRCRVRLRLRDEGPEALHRDLAGMDPVVAAGLNPQDGHRIVRAMEVMQTTGQSIATFQQRTGPMIVDPARARKIVVLPDRVALKRRIDGRFQTMLDMGAEDEVRALMALGLSAEMPVMKAIGVSQIAAMFKGEMSRAEVLQTGAAATRQYAKRQMTWFRNQMDESWERFDPLA